MRLPVLRETRMTAVVCSLGPVQRVVDAAPVIGDAVVEALAAWAASPLPEGDVVAANRPAHALSSTTVHRPSLRAGSAL